MELDIRVGMGATHQLWSDRHAYTISRISESGKTFWMTRDTAIMQEFSTIFTHQNYKYKKNPDGPVRRVFRNKYDVWQMSGTHDQVFVGYRNEYYDPSF